MELYVARDKNNELYLYNDLPIRCEITDQFFENGNHEGEFLQLDSNLFPDIKWENEPQKVVLLEIK